MTVSGQGLYDPRFEHDACGIGALVNLKGKKSHQTVDNALKIVEKLEHRAGKDATGDTGDGVGILLQISYEFFRQVAEQADIFVGGERDYGVGMFFLPQETLPRSQAMKMLEIIVQKEGMPFLGWRKVPVAEDVLGQRARNCMPSIWQCFIGRLRDVERGLDFDRRLYVARRVFEQPSDNTYVVSMSSRSIVYKGMFLVSQLRRFYPDLQDARYESAIALVHLRFSTNTNPSWERAHPNRLPGPAQRRNQHHPRECRPHDGARRNHAFARCRHVPHFPRQGRRHALHPRDGVLQRHPAGVRQ